LYLVDTDVVSELRRLRPHGGVLAWLNDVKDEQLHLSAVTIGELQVGVERARERDAERAKILETWIEQVAQGWNVLPMEGRAFRQWARLMHHRPKEMSEDAMIAATAMVHGLIVVTGNVRDFGSLGVRTLDPFAYR
jgi:toxin FitB